MKAALIALALLATPAAADTVVIDSNPAVFPVQFPELYNQLEADYDRGAYHTVFYDWNNFYNSYPRDTLFVAINSASTIPFQQAYYVVSDYGTISIVPEPATWALLLFGFAFFGLRQFWPGASHE